MKNNLLSIFPLRGEEAYVRISCIELEESRHLTAEPILASRSELVALLAATSMDGAGSKAIADVDQGTVVQIPIGDDDARAIGFYPRLS